jgi:hypothetical protein
MLKAFIATLRGTERMLLIPVLLGSMLCRGPQAQSSQGTDKPEATTGNDVMIPAQRQQYGTNRAEHAHSQRHRRLTLDDRIKLLARSLDLSDSQTTAIKTILEERQREAVHLRLDPSINGNTRIGRFRKLQDDTVERIRAVLNDEQKKRYDPLATRKLQPAPDQRTVEDWLKVTAPK